MPDLRKFDEDWKKEGEPPDGEWDCEIESVSFGESRKGTPMLKGRFTVTSPAWAGYTIRYQRAITQNTLGWLKGDLRKMGVDVEKFSLSQLESDPGLLIQLKGNRVRVKKSPQKNDPQFSDVQLLERPKKEEFEPEPESDATEPETTKSTESTEPEPWDKDKDDDEPAF